jgi:hypothetical protein
MATENEKRPQTLEPKRLSPRVKKGRAGEDGAPYFKKNSLKTAFFRSPAVRASREPAGTEAAQGVARAGS